MLGPPNNPQRSEEANSSTLLPPAAQCQLQHRQSDPASSTRDREEFSTLQQAREAYERDYILKELDRCHGNVSRAAESLGLERSHLYRKMKALGISTHE